jgi:hypothetical protein
MHRRQRQHGNGDGGARHVDGGTQRDGNRVGVFDPDSASPHSAMFTGMLAAELRVKKAVHAALAQAGKHQRVRVPTDLPVTRAAGSAPAPPAACSRSAPPAVAHSPSSAPKAGGPPAWKSHQTEDAEWSAKRITARTTRVTACRHVVDQRFGGFRGRGAAPAPDPRPRPGCRCSWRSSAHGIGLATTLISRPRSTSTMPDGGVISPALRWSPAPALDGNRKLTTTAVTSAAAKVPSR